MISLMIRVSFALLVLNQLLTPVAAFRNSGSRGGSYGKYDRGYKEPSKPQIMAATSAGLPSQNTARRGLGLSAWGIVIVVVALILAGMGFYYFSICYDICSHPKNKYNKMSLPTMA